MEKLSPELQNHIRSGIQTFLTTFIVVVGTTLQDGAILWTGAFWSSLVLVAVRAGVKEVFAKFATPALGGRKKV